MATLSKLIITSFLPLIVFISPAICQSTDEVVDAYFLIDQGKEARDSDVVLKIIQLEIQGRQKEFRSQLKNLYGNKKVKPSKALLIEALYFNTIARDTALANSAILRYRSQFPNSLTGIYWQTKFWIEQSRGLKAERQLAIIVDKNPDWNNYGILNLLQAQTYQSLQNTDRQLAAVNTCLALTPKLNSIQVLATILKARVAQRNGDLTSAINDLSTASKRADDIGYGYGKALAINDLSYANILTRNLNLAVIEANRALEIWIKLGDSFNEGQAINNKTIALDELGNRDEAKKGYERFLEINRELGYNRGTANALHNLAYFLTEQGDYILAQKYMDESFAYLRMRDQH